MTNYEKKLVSVFSLFIRNRDRHLGCISCGCFVMFCKFEDGHYIQRGNHALKFNEWNNNGQCHWCNSMLNGNHEAYRERLIKKIGIEKVEWLESQKNVIYQMKLWEIKELLSHYQQELKKLGI